MNLPRLSQIDPELLKRVETTEKELAEAARQAVVLLEERLVQREAEDTADLRALVYDLTVMRLLAKGGMPPPGMPWHYGG